MFSCYRIYLPMMITSISRNDLTVFVPARRKHRWFLTFVISCQWSSSMPMFFTRTPKINKLCWLRRCRLISGARMDRFVSQSVFWSAIARALCIVEFFGAAWQDPVDEAQPLLRGFAKRIIPVMFSTSICLLRIFFFFRETCVFIIVSIVYLSKHKQNAVRVMRRTRIVDSELYYTIFVKSRAHKNDESVSSRFIRTVRFWRNHLLHLAKPRLS